MSDQMALPSPPEHKLLPAPPAPTVAADPWARRQFRALLALQREALWWQRILFGAACVAGPPLRS